MESYIKKMAFIISFWLLISGQANMQESNLLVNGGFEQGGTDWSFRSSGKVDTNEAYTGRSSLRMHGISTNTWNVVNSRSIIADQEAYYLSFYCKNIAFTGTIRAGLRWIDNSGQISIQYDWITLENDTDWKFYSFLAVPPEGASKVEVYLFVGADVTGFVWFDDISLIEGKPEMEQEGITGSGPLGFRGTILTEVSYTPEEKWIAGNRIQLYSDIAFGTSTKAYIHLGGWLPRQDEFRSFGDLDQANADFAIKRCYLEIDAPLFSGFNSMRTTLGDLSINYSPFIAKLDRWDLWYWDVIDKPDNPYSYNRSRRGISIETTEPGRIITSSFILWDGDPEQYAYGGKLVFGNEKNQLGFVMTNYFDRKEIPHGETPRTKEHSLSVDGRIELGSVQFNAVSAFDQKLSNQSLTQNNGMYLVSLKYNTSNFGSIKYGFWSFDKDFAPRYRDKTPRFDPCTGEKLKWNLVDRFAGQVGQGVEVSISSGNLDVEFKNYFATRELERVEYLKNIELNMSGEYWRTFVEVYGEYEVIESQAGDPEEENYYYYAVASYPLTKSQLTDLNLELNYSFDKETSFWQKREYVLLSSQVKVGYLRGAKLFVGKRFLEKENTKQKAFVCGIDFLLAKAINLTLRYASPNERETLNPELKIPRYNIRGGPQLADNIIKLSARVEF